MFYLHIPKTGGQTLAHRLASAFAPDKVHMMQEELKYPGDMDKLTSLLREKEFVESHVAGAMLSDRADLQILCTVREPIGQTLSNWRHIRRDSSNRWHRAAHKLSPGKFFDLFGDDFLNHQTRYAISAFVDLDQLIDRIGYFRAMNGNFQMSLDRIRWLVPTESIDEFVDLWLMETKRNVPNRDAMINVAADEGSDLNEARAAILARPRQHAYDQLLYEIAKDRFAAYRREISQLVAPWSYPDDSRRAYRGERGGIWLAENWHDPEVVVGRQTAWWVGPRRVSEVRIWRANNEHVLKFLITVVNGIEYSDIAVKSKDTGKELKTVKTVRSLDSTGIGMEYSISLESLKQKDTILLISPQCFAPILTRDDDPSVMRRSFLASGWRLEKGPV